jgi:hypothetical protein
LLKGFGDYVSNVHSAPPSTSPTSGRHRRRQRIPRFDLAD